jgi:inorganic triphosphatase YgiF
LPDDLPDELDVDRSANLRELFATQVQRKSFVLVSNGATMEISFDRGDIVTADGQVQPISEIELELKHGDRAELFRLARRVVESAPVSFSLVSKGERGFLAAEKKSAVARKASKIHLSRDATVADAFVAICRACLHDFMLNLPASHLSSDSRADRAMDIETVHQARVAIRRLRTAMSFFRPCVEDADFARLQVGFRWISGLLGTARDFDVWQAETIDRELARQKPGEGYLELASAMEERRINAHRQLAEAVKSPRLGLLLLDLAIWLEAGEWRVNRNESTSPLLSFLQPQMRKTVRRLRRKGRNLNALDEHAQHGLRIRAKKLRYSIEFFASLLDTPKQRRRARRALKALEEFQAAIGKLHDSATLAEFLSANFGGGGDQDAECDRAASFAAGRLAASPIRRGKIHNAAGRSFTRFSKTRISFG